MEASVMEASVTSDVDGSLASDTLGVALTSANVVTDPVVLDRALIGGLVQWETVRGELALACVPALAPVHLLRIQTLAGLMGHPFSSVELQRVQQTLQTRLEEGFAASPYSRLIVRYASAQKPKTGLVWEIQVAVVSQTDQVKNFLKYRPPEQFGVYPDAKVMAVAQTLNPAAAVPVLDVGAGTGRNAAALALRGHPVDAIETTSVAVEAIQAFAKRLQVAVKVMQMDVLNPVAILPSDRYGLILLSGVVPYFQRPREVKALLAQLVPALRPDGLLLFDAFVTTDGYVPSGLVRQVAHSMDGALLTRPELDQVMADLPLTLVSDESAFEYESAHLEPAARATRAWLDSWATAERLFALPNGQKPPISLRWLLYQRHS